MVGPDPISEAGRATSSLIEARLARRDHADRLVRIRVLLEHRDMVVRIPNSSSHCIIGALIGASIGNALLMSRPLGVSVEP
jgi:hypothetical protein